MESFTNCYGIIDYEIKDSNIIYIEWIEVENKGLGNGSELMKSFIKEFPNHIIELITTCPYDNLSPRDNISYLKRLLNFYKRLGFETNFKGIINPFERIFMFKNIS